MYLTQNSNRHRMTVIVQRTRYQTGMMQRTCHVIGSFLNSLTKKGISG